MGSKRKQGRKKSQKGQRGQKGQNGQRGQKVYFIRRKSHVDDSQFFNDEGRRIAFAKVTHASWFMRQFDADQGARIVSGHKQPDDVPFVEVLPHWLPARQAGGPEGTTPQEFLAAIEQTTADVLAGREPSRRAVRAFLKERKRVVSHFGG